MLRSEVRYPGLSDFVGLEIAQRQMRGYGGMITLFYDGTQEETTAFVDRLQIFTIAASLGGAESLVTQPVTTTHHDLSVSERERRGIPGNMVRLSCGLEDPEDLIDDLKQAL